MTAEASRQRFTHPPADEVGAGTLFDRFAGRVDIPNDEVATIVDGAEDDHTLVHLVDEVAVAPLLVPKLPQHRLGDPEEQRRAKRDEHEPEHADGAGGGYEGAAEFGHVDLGDDTRAEQRQGLVGGEDVNTAIVTGDNRAALTGKRPPHGLSRSTADAAIGINKRQDQRRVDRGRSVAYPIDDGVVLALRQRELARLPEAERPRARFPLQTQRNLPCLGRRHAAPLQVNGQRLDNDGLAARQIRQAFAFLIERGFIEDQDGDAAECRGDNRQN